MCLKKVMYNQHDSYMHPPISAFACYNTPLQASYQSDTCKRRTTLKKRINMWWVFDYPATSHWAGCPFFYFDRVLRTNPVCLSGLFPDLHLPTHFIAVTTSRTTSTLHDSSPPLLSRVVVTQTGVVELRRSLAGKVGVSPFPIVD